ncbi:MAG: T9SS type A sorting domain-containing protein [Flavobacterium sp. JAD_PAG50586_2]|nr:MAG: T9SS type A sorting domain-containing protein [Flavobacterium sp. JAD_PAG50586_2]
MPLINNQVVVPDSGQQNDDEEPGTRSINLSFSYNCTLGTTDVGYYPSAKVQVSGRNSLDEPVWKDLTGWLSDTEFFATFSLTNLKIRSTEVADNSTVRIIFSFQGTEIYTCSLARPSRSIEFNNIYSSQTIQSGQTVQPFTSSQPNIWVTGGELECPYRIKCNDPKIYSNVTNYQWQIKQNSGNWTNLPNVTSKDYTPTNQFTSNTSYRRIAFYNGLYCMSLPIDIIVAAPVVNSICCTQNLPTYNSQPQPITGNIPALNGNFSYQWQIAPNLYNPMVWQNINGATSQNYTHIFTNPALRGTLVTTFRRLLIQNGSTINISNEITVNRPNRTAKYINTEDNDMLLTDSDVLIYPNPVSNLLNVEFEDGSSTPEKILIYDISGREINLNIITNSENQIQLDFSGVSSGTYYLKFENAEKLITKKIIKNN